MNTLLYNFVGTHSLLGGLFLFFLPVLLYTNGFGITAISSFIAITWGSFIVAMYIWDRIRFHYGYRPIIIISLLLQIGLVGVWYLEKNILFLVLLAIIYGFYNCFFWITKRFLFSLYTPEKSIGNEFWNIQILAFILVKVGILFSSFFLEYNIYGYIFLLMSIVSVWSLWYFLKHEKDLSIRSQKHSFTPVSIKEIASFTDAKKSRPVFILDGPFLYFESFFWVMSLFFISMESFQNLWILAIWLALSFSIIFFIIKQHVDHINGKKLFYGAVILYSLSWVLRGTIEHIDASTLFYSSIICITFCSTFFRLVFNKNFFLLSKKTPSNSYLLYKSYYSQASVMLLFGLLALTSFYLRLSLEEILVWSYLWAAPLSIAYMMYHVDNISLKN